jgi:hypothetical protein
VALSPSLSLTPIGLISFFVLIFLTSFINRSYLSSKTLVLLRVFFPSWRFFDQLGHVPRLSYRMNHGRTHDVEAWGEWKDCLNHPPRTIGALCLNANGNLHLAYQALVDRLVHDIQELQESSHEGQSSLLLESVSYQLVRNLAHKQVQEQRVISSADKNVPSSFQFKIVIDQEDLLISSIHEV